MDVLETPGERLGGAASRRKRPKVVAVIMTYNCARLLPKAYAKIPRDLVDDILVTDDGSRDGSYEVACRLGIPAYRHVPNRGYGGNLKQGLCYALEQGADYVVEVHGDGQFDPGAIRHAVPLMEQGIHFIIGSRFQNPKRALENGMPLIRYLANRGLSVIDRLILRLPFTEFHTGFRIYSKEMLKRTAWGENADNYLFSFQIIAQAAYANLTTAEVPVDADYKGDHTSHSVRGAAVYAVQTFGVLAQYLLARFGLRYHRLFPPPNTAGHPTVSAQTMITFHTAKREKRSNTGDAPTLLRQGSGWAPAGSPKRESAAPSEVPLVAGRSGGERPGGACRGCGEPSLRELFTLGNVPSVNTFLSAEELHRERPYPLTVCWCARCTLVQLGTIIPPSDLFTEYQHLSSASQSNIQHLQELKDLLTGRLSVGPRTRVLEVGSNDGTLLAAFRGTAGGLLGVDPAENLAPRAQEQGIEQIPAFLTEELAEQIIEGHGRYDLVLALNVVAHTPDVNGLLRAVKRVLKPGGTFVMEAVYVLETILRGEFDTVYHEHVYCFSLTALQNLFSRTGLVIADVERIPTQGGSLRVYGQHLEEGRAPTTAVAELLAAEASAGVRDPEVYLRVGDRVRQFQGALREELQELHARHGRIFGLGAPARGVMILNACAIGPDLVTAVVDDTPLKQGRLVPGVHIPVVPWDALSRDPPAAYLLLSWNYEREILAKLRRFVRSAEILVPFPEIRRTVLVPESREAVHVR